MVALGERLCLSALLMARRSFIFTLPGESLDLYLTQMSFTFSSVEVDILNTLYSLRTRQDVRVESRKLRDGRDQKHTTTFRWPLLMRFKWKKISS